MKREEKTRLKSECSSCCMGQGAEELKSKVKLDMEREECCVVLTAKTSSEPGHQPDLREYGVTSKTTKFSRFTNYWRSWGLWQQLSPCPGGALATSPPDSKWTQEGQGTQTILPHGPRGELFHNTGTGWVRRCWALDLSCQAESRNSTSKD